MPRYVGHIGAKMLFAVFNFVKNTCFFNSIVDIFSQMRAHNAVSPRAHRKHI